MKISSENPMIFDISGNPVNFDVKKCGDGPDPDFINQEITISSHPITPPINPPYKESIDFRRKSS